MKSYLDILQKIIDTGIKKKNRTGIDTISISGHMFEHDMNDGFPLLTTKKMAVKTMAVELEGFIKGITSKQWYKDRGCNIWNQWCNPKKVPYGHDEETKKQMGLEDDLGPIYGKQWRNWQTHNGYSVDQLATTITKLKTNPFDRRLIINSWNISDLSDMSLVPCHYSFQFLSDGENLDLLWNQRSVDVPLGLPFNIASYGLLLSLIAKEVSMKPRKLIGFLADVHIYENQLDGVYEQLKRTTHELPTLELPDFSSVLEWEHTQMKINKYKHEPKIKFPIAI